jgi:hypothetical protein
MDNNVIWKIEGLNWVKKIKASLFTDPIEIATQAFESLKLKRKSNLYLDTGLIFFVSHSKMRSDSDTFVVCAQMVLANAGLHHEATQLNFLLKSLEEKIA